MRMSKAKRQAASKAAAHKIYVVAYVPYGRGDYGQPLLKPAPHRYGPDQFRFHLENVLAMAKTSGAIVRAETIRRFLNGKLQYITLNGVVYENRNYNSLQLPMQGLVNLLLTAELIDRYKGDWTRKESK